MVKVTIESEERDTSSSNENFFTLKFYFTVGYYFGIIPFKPVYNQVSSEWEMKTWRPQQVATCLLVRIPWWIYLLTTFQGTMSGLMGSTGTSSSKTYFIVLRHLLNLWKSGHYTSILHRNRKQIEKTFNAVSGSKVHFPCKSSKISSLRKKIMNRNKNVLVFGFLFILLFTFSLHIAFTFFMQNTLSSLTTPDKLFPAFINEARKRFFANSKKNTEIITRYTTGNVVLGVLEIWLRVVHLMLNVTYMETFFLATLPLTLWLAARNFEAFVMEAINSDCDTQNWANSDELPCKKYRRLVDMYMELKAFTEVLNSTWSNLKLVWVIDNAMRLVFTFKDFLENANAFNIIVAFTSIACWGFEMWVSGDVYRTMDRLKYKIRDLEDECILQNGENTKELTYVKILLAKLDDEAIGIGIIGLYRYSYGFIAQLLVVIITLFIVSFEQ